MKKDWPYLVERPGRGQVRACPACGRVAVFSCHHGGRSINTVVMNAARAAWLRRTSGEYAPRLLRCDGCGYEGPVEVGSSLGPGYRCARCSGKSERQVEVARRQMAVPRLPRTPRSDGTTGSPAEKLPHHLTPSQKLALIVKQRKLKVEFLRRDKA